MRIRLPWTESRHLRRTILCLLPLLTVLIALTPAAQSQALQNDPQNAPALVALPINHPFPVTLGEALSTRVSKKGQVVTFHLAYSIILANGLEVPPDTKILGHIAEVKRAGHFDAQGALHLVVDRIQLNATSGAAIATDITAHLDPVGTGKPPELEGGSSASNDGKELAINPAGGALIGGVSGGAAGAGIGAAAGTAAAVLVLLSRRGQELYIAADTRFLLTLDAPAYLGVDAIRTAQSNFKQNPGPYGIEVDSNDDGMPKLKKRRAPQQ